MLQSNSVTYKTVIAMLMYKDIQSCIKATTGALRSSSKCPSSNGEDEAHLPPSAKLRRPPLNIPIGLWWNCSSDTRFVWWVEMSFSDPPVVALKGFWPCYLQNTNVTHQGRTNLNLIISANIRYPSDIPHEFTSYHYMSRQDPVSTDKGLN